MSRYLTETVDTAEQLEKWVEELTEETNKRLDDSEIYDVILKEEVKLDTNDMLEDQSDSTD